MALIIDGSSYQVPGVTVIDYKTSGLTWKTGTSGTRKRTEPITRYVHHWVGSDRSKVDAIGAKGCFQTLTNRGLSVQLFLGYTGIVYQYTDLMVVCSHAGRHMNGGAIGIEMQNCGHGRPNPKVPRARQPETIHGVTRQTSQFTHEQLLSAWKLRLFIGEMFSMPVRTMPDPGVISLARRKAHRGDLMHYQISDDKRDPGLAFMDYIDGP